jgi:hypothetical protein
MGKQKTTTLVMILTILLSTGAWTLVVALGGGGELAVVAMFLVGGLGVDQVSRLIMRDDQPK